MKKLRKAYIPFVVMLLVQALYHLMMRESMGADAIFYFGSKLDEYSLLEFIKMRYQTWSSRLLIEGVLIYLSRNIVLWKILDSFVWLLLAVVLSCLLPIKENGNWLAVGLVLIYPMADLSSAGWIATTLNYVWPLAFGLLVLLGIAKLLREEKISVTLFLISIPALLFAGNMEQMCAILFGSCVLSTLYFVLRKENIKKWWQLLIWLALSLAEIVFIYTCPGNKVRAKESIGLYLPYFQKYNFWDKLNLGFQDTMKHLFLSGNLLMYIFCFVLMAMVWVKSTNKAYRLLGMLPCLCVSVGTLFFETVKQKLSMFGDVLEKNEIISGGNYLFGFSYVPFLLYAVLLYCIAISFVIISTSWKELFVYGMVFGLGFASRVAIGFSASVFASSDRTLIYLYFSLIILVLYMFYKNIAEICRHEKVATGIWMLTGSMAFFSVWNNVVDVSAKL